MRIPVTQLDDRSFDDLVTEARARMARFLPDIEAVPDGDPLHAMIDLFAFMTESVIYRANLIPERQRQAFLNLLGLPLRPARPARGLVSIDARPRQNQLEVAPLLRAETTLTGAGQTFTTEGEITPLPLALKLLIKERIEANVLLEAGITPQQLVEQYGGAVTAFRPRSFPVGEPVDLATSLDGHLYLLLHLPEARFVDQAAAVREAVAGRTLNIGLAPIADLPGEIAEEVFPRQLLWEIAFQESATGQPRWLPLEVLDDSSEGGRKTGVVRLRLPRSADALTSDFADDPREAGFGSRPPEAPAGVEPAQVLIWIRVSAPDEEVLTLGHCDINAVAVTGQGTARAVPLGTGTGRPNQIVTLPHQDIDPATLILEVAEGGAYRPWSRIGHFEGRGPEDRVFRLDPRTGIVDFGDGLRGAMPPPAAPIRAATYRYGGGPEGNAAPGTVRRLEASSTRYTVRQPWPLSGGTPAETIPEAEARIPAFLTHRARAVTREDFATLARDNPVTRIARAEVIPGMIPGASLAAARFDVPGAVSLFVLPPAPMALAAAPRPSVGQLRDVYSYIDARKTLGTEHYVLSPQYVPLALSVAMTPVDPRTELALRETVRMALLAFLWALPPGGPAGTGWALGRAVDVNELRTAASRVPGLQAVTGLALWHRMGARPWTPLRSTSLELARYQLPELMDVHVGASVETPGVVRAEDGVDTPPRPQPAPVAPDIC
ncbi:MAG: putative baseplate assembly protein [Pseudomonadota bacterium]